MKIIVNMDYISPTVPYHVDDACDLIDKDVLNQLLVGIEEIREYYTDIYNEEDCSYSFVDDIDYKIEMAARLFNHHNNYEYDSEVYSFFDGTTKVRINPNGRLSFLREQGKDDPSEDSVELDKSNHIINATILADRRCNKYNPNDYTSIIFITHISVWLKSFPCITYIEKLNWKSIIYNIIDRREIIKWS